MIGKRYDIIKMQYLDSARRTVETFKDMRKVKKGKRYRNAYELPATIRKYAAFSSGAYDKKNKKIRGYTLDEQLSTDQFRIFTKGEGGKVVFAIRGSSTEAAWNDFVVNDLRGIAAGNEHLQLQQAREKLEEVLEKYPDKQKLTLTGHSVGSLSASVLGAQNGIRTIGFNSGSSPYGGKKYQDFLKDTFSSKHVTNVIQEGDIVSAAGVKWMRDENTHVLMNKKRALKNTIDKHLMKNFTENEHLTKIKEHLQANNVEGVDHIVDKLKGKSDESLKRRHDKLIKRDLKGGGNMRLDIGHTFGGGMHARYNNVKGNTFEIAGQQVPKKGATIFFNTFKNVMYIFDKEHNMHLLTGTMAEKGETLKLARNYDRGATVIADDRFSPPKKQVAFIPAHGGAGWMMASAVSKKDWENVLGGNQFVGKKEGFWSGKTQRDGYPLYAGQGAVNPFTEHPIKTQEDANVGVLDDVGEFLVHNAVTILETGAELALDAVTAGLAEPVIQAVKVAKGVAKAVMAATGVDDSLQGEINKLLPNRRQNMDNIEDMFGKAITADGSKPFQNPVEELTFDDRIPFRLKRLDGSWDKVRSEANQINLSYAEQQKLLLLHPNFAVDKDSQVEQSKALDMLEKKYKHMDAGMKAVIKLQPYHDKAVKVGLGKTTQKAYNKMMKDLIPDRKKHIKKWDSVDSSKWDKEVEEAKSSLNNAVTFGIGHASDVIQKETLKQLDYDNSIVKPMIGKMATKAEFEKLYTGKQEGKHWTTEKSLEYKKYQQEMWTAYRTEQGLYHGFDPTTLGKADQVFVKKYRKTNKPLSSYVQADYFRGKTDKMTELVDLQHSTQIKMHEDAMKKMSDLQDTKQKTIPEI